MYAATDNQLALLQRKAQEKKNEQANFYRFQRLDEKKKRSFFPWPSNLY